MDTDIVKVVMPADPSYLDNCFLGDRHCVNSWRMTKWLDMAASIHNIRFFAPRINQTIVSTPEMLDLVRSGFGDMTYPCFFPKSDRLQNISVMSAVIKYDCGAFIVNRKLLDKEIIWKDVFNIDIWIVVLLWQLLCVVLPSFSRDTRGLTAHKILNLFLAIFTFFADSYFSTFCIEKSFVRWSFPFMTVEEANSFLLANPEARYVTEFSRHQIEQDQFGQVMIVPRKQLIESLSKNILWFSFGDSDYFRHLLPFGHPKVVGLESSECAFYAVAFCRKTFFGKDAITRGLLSLNELGFSERTYIHKRYNKIKLKKLRLQPLEPIDFRQMYSSVLAWSCGAVACVALIFVEKAIRWIDARIGWFLRSY